MQEDHTPSRKFDEAPEAAACFKAGDTVRRRVGGQEVVIKRTLPLPPSALRAHAEDGAPPPPFEYECYWFEGTQYRAGVVFEFELVDVKGAAT